MLKPGQVINRRYQIVEQIAVGGQSIVYLAKDQNMFDRRVVVKEFRLGPGTPAEYEAALRQFETSARMLAQLSHPGIAQVLDYFTVNNVPVLVIEYVPGETLEQKLKLAPMGLPEEQVLNIAEQLCDVLAYLHSQTPPIIYRDLTPGNVMVMPDGKVKLIDFGIARTFKVGKALDTEPLGTTGYAAPEQHGKGQTGPYSDVYALGVTLLRAVTGYDPSQTPFMLPRADKVHGDLKYVSPTLTAAIARATELEVSKRFQTVAEFREALRSRRRAGVPSGPSFWQRYRALFGTLVLFLLVVALLGGSIGLMVASATGLFSFSTSTTTSSPLSFGVTLYPPTPPPTP
ncbi:MAG: serine/threonine-protein kinase [Anaerolineae bacterium]|nr:serine/threonine protein kinase [Thermoflexales bacterium]MDW8396291.1 serine/threonine-protein kinase [Anaerolineae bacterium]